MRSGSSIGAGTHDSVKVKATIDSGFNFQGKEMRDATSQGLCFAQPALSVFVQLSPNLDTFPALPN
jgi:hypothetical protein